MASFLTPSHNRWVEFIQSQFYSWVPLSARCWTGCKVPDGMLVLNPYLNCRGLGAIPASACTYLPGLNSFFFLKHLGISLLLLSMAQIFFFFFFFTGFHGFGALGKFPSKPAQSGMDTGGCSASLCQAPTVCRLGTTDAGFSLSNRCALALFFTLRRIILKAFLLAIGSGAKLKNNFQASRHNCLCFVIIFVVYVKPGIWPCAVGGRESRTQSFLLWLTCSFAQ